MVAHVSNLSTWDTKAEELWVQGQSEQTISKKQGPRISLESEQVAYSRHQLKDTDQDPHDEWVRDLLDATKF